jgi:hypothetical protein
MFGVEVVLTLIILRIILPIALALWLGEWVRQRETSYWFR